MGRPLRRIALDLGWVRRGILALATIFALVAPVLGLWITVEGSVTRDLIARATRDRLQTAELASNLLAHHIDDDRAVVGILAARPDLRRGLATGDRRLIAQQISAFETAWPSFGSVLAIDANGTEIAVASGGAIAGAVVDGIPQLQGTGVGGDRSTRDYFSGALASTATYASAPYVSAAPGNPVLVALSAAVREDGRIVGVVVATIAPADLIAMITASLSATASAPGRAILIVDRAGHVVASTDKARLPLSDAALPGTESALAGEHGSLSVTLDGRERVLTAVPIDGTAWVLYVIDDTVVVLGVERGLKRNVTIAAAAMLVVAFLGAGVVVALFSALRRRRDEMLASRTALEDANADLALASRHKSEFLSSVSHELRTPLNSIIGFTDLLDEQLHDAITERQRRYFRNVRTAGEHLLELINDVLDLSRVESGRIELRTEAISLEQLLEPVISNIRRSAADKGIAFDASVSGGTVLVDHARMRQVLYNLGSNAVKFTKPGGTVSCRAWIDGDTLAVDVRDTGIGIPADRQDRVFGMFERVNEDRSDAKGTGLGLALSKLLVELHGGTIGFESVADEGSTFRIRIPGVVAREPEPGTRMEVAGAHPAG